MASLPVPSQAMSLVIGRNTVPVSDYADASAKYAAVRDASGLGGSGMPEGKIYLAETMVARVSYNGRVWNIEHSAPGARPLYDPNGFYGDPQDLFPKSTLPVPSFAKRQRVLFRRSILCGRAPEFGFIVKAHEGDMADWYVIRHEGEKEASGSEHGSMLTLATEDWREVERARLLAEADEAVRFSNTNAIYRDKAESLRKIAAGL